jgi:hypothetical protein
VVTPLQRPKTVLDVHILPLAREVDRAVLPFLATEARPAILHAHRIILLVPDAPQARRIAAKVERALQPVAGIERHDLASDPNHPTAGLQGILQQISGLIRREMEAGNRVHINLSSGSKLVAFAAGLAGMAHLREGTGSVYYVQHEGVTLSQEDFEEHGHTRGVLDVEELELMPVLLPDPVQLQSLAYLRHQQGGRAEYRDLLDFLCKIPEAGFQPSQGGTPLQVRNWNNAATTRMVRKVVGPLSEQGLIEVLDAGRQKAVRITPRGQLYAAISGLDKPRFPEASAPQSQPPAPPVMTVQTPGMN